MFLEHQPTFATHRDKLRLAPCKSRRVLLAQSQFPAAFRSWGVRAGKREVCFQILALFRRRHGVTVFVGWESCPGPPEVQLFQLLVGASPDLWLRIAACVAM